MAVEHSYLLCIKYNYSRPSLVGMEGHGLNCTHSNFEQSRPGGWGFIGSPIKDFIVSFIRGSNGPPLVVHRVPH